MAEHDRGSMTGVGLYSISFASRLVHVEQQTIRRWLFGYERAGQTYPPISRSRLPSYDGRYAASFLELMELLVVRRFLDLGVSLPMIRKVAEKARQLLRTDYPFSTRLFKTDGRSIFADFEWEAPNAMLEVIRDQWVFEEVVGPSLHDLDYPNEKGTTSPYLWWPAGRDSLVVINPCLSFGMPVVRGGWVPTRMLANQAKANDVETAARLYEVTEQAVVEAVAFEERLAA